MRRRRPPVGSILFWICFVPYVVGVAVWLLFGLLPSLVHESGSLHTELHEQADDALQANGGATTSPCGGPTGGRSSTVRAWSGPGPSGTAS
jgi:hypothetical protein